jgi:hypothetical protein
MKKLPEIPEAFLFLESRRSRPILNFIYFLLPIGILMPVDQCTINFNVNYFFDFQFSETAVRKEEKEK